LDSSYAAGAVVAGDAVAIAIVRAATTSFYFFKKIDVEADAKEQRGKK
jgi:hypothetical protein